MNSWCIAMKYSYLLQQLLHRKLSLQPTGMHSRVMCTFLSLVPRPSPRAKKKRIFFARGEGLGTRLYISSHASMVLYASTNDNVTVLTPSPP